MDRKRKLIEDLLKELVKESIGAASRKKGEIYETYLSQKFKNFGIKIEDVAGSEDKTDLVVYDANKIPHGIEVKVSQRADMGSAKIVYDSKKKELIVQDSSPIAQAIVESGEMARINGDEIFIKNISMLHDAGLLNKSVPSEALMNFKKSTGLPTQPGRSIKLGKSDIILKHYSMKSGVVPAYIQIRHRGLYVLDPQHDPLGLLKLGAIPFEGNVSISIKVAQKGSSSPGSQSNLRLSAKVKLTGGLPSSKMNLDTDEGMKKFVTALGFAKNIQNNLIIDQ